MLNTIETRLFIRNKKIWVKKLPQNTEKGHFQQKIKPKIVLIGQNSPFLYESYIAMVQECQSNLDALIQ